MRGHIVKSIFIKELTDMLRDKKTFFMNVILPIILYPTIIIVFSMIMNMSYSSMAEKTLNVAFSQKPDAGFLQHIEHLDEAEGKLNIVEVEDYQLAIENREIAAYIEVLDEGLNYNLYVNNSIEDNTEALGRLETLLALYKEDLVRDNLLAMGLEPDVILEPLQYEVINVAETEQMAGYILGMILPFILVTGILTGAVTPAIDMMAGEKERGTLETLMTLPISNLELVMGKYIAVSLSAIVSAVMSVLSILLSVVFLFMTMGATLEGATLTINTSQLIMPAIITFVCICIFAMAMSAISMCICALAKTFKEAQNASTPILLVGMLLSYSSMLPNLELNSMTATIPIVNVVLLIKSVLSFRYNVSLLAIVLISNIVFVILAVWLLSKLFNSEEVLFGNGKGFSFLEKRSNIKAGTMPTMSDGIIIYGLSFLLMMYVGSYLQVKFGMGGLAASQVMFLVLPIGLSFYIKTDFKKVYALKLPSISAVLGGICLWLGIYLLSSILVNLIMYFFPSNQAVAEGLEIALFNEHSLFINLLVVAMMPALCEEILFRGFIFTAFKGVDHSKRAILVSSILFGIMHIDFVRIVPTTLLGLGMAYAVYRSGSLLVGVIIHFINNGLSVLAMHDKLGPIERLFEQVEVNFEAFRVSQLFLVVALMILLILLGKLLLNLGKNGKNKIEAPSTEII